MQRSTTEQRRYCTGIALHDLNNRWLQYTLALVILLFSLSVRVHAGEPRQDITLSLREATLDKVFKEIRKQTGYSFVYTETEIQRANKVTIQVSNSSLDNVLSLCFRNQPLTYTIVDKIVVVKPKAEKPAAIAVVNSLAGDPKKITMRGRVLNEKGEPLAGATITVRRTDMSAITDHEGYFSLTEVEEDAVLVVSSVGHVTQLVKLSGRLSLDVKLPIAVKEEEEVVVAYNKISQRSNTGAVTVVKGADVQNLPNRSVDKSLQGLVPGLLVTSGTGQPGGGLSNFVLRGIATADNGLNGSTLRNPLIVVDGMPVTQDAQQLRLLSIDAVPLSNPMAQLNPSDIETISILKDAAAIALYGSKASNGVILITTKRGKAGKTIFNFRSQVDFARRANEPELLNQSEYLELLYETYKNTSATWTDEKILTDLKSKFPTKSDGSFYPFTNLGDLVYNDKALTFSNEISISGGNERSLFYLNLEYTKQNGIYRKTGYDRKSIRYNFENKVSNWLKIGMNTTLSYNVQDYGFIESDPFQSSLYSNPLNPIYLENGEYYLNYSFPASPNPIAAMDYNSSKNISYRGLAKLFGELNFSKTLKLISNLGFDYQLTESKEKRDPRLYDPQTKTTGTGRIEEADSRYANLINTNIISYTNNIKNNHGLNFLLGQEAQILTQKIITAQGTSLNFITNDQINQTATRTSTGTASKQTLLSYFGQANYDWDRKYFISASLRTDGSSKFGVDRRFGTYWSAGAAWVLSGESFMQGTKNWLDFLKLRGSIGAAGNSGAIGRYTKYDLLRALNYLNTSTLALPPVGDQPANPDIQWEQTFTWDAGLECRIWKERISLTADIYHRKTSDLVYSIQLPLTSGYSSILDNIGDMENKGIEISLSADFIKSKQIKWNLSANWSTNKNKLVKADFPLAKVTGSLLANEEGRSFNSYYIPIWAGVDPATGIGMWIDSTGKPNTNYNAAKPQFVGKPQPDGFGSVTNTLSYRGVSFSFQLYYQYGFKIYNASNLVNDGQLAYANQDRAALNRWQKNGDIAINPKRTLNNFDAGRFSTRNLYNGDFIQLQNLTISYTLPRSICQQLHLNSFRVYAQAYNLAIWSTKKQVQDIGNQSSQGRFRNDSYPMPKSLSIGLNVNF